MLLSLWMRPILAAVLQGISAPAALSEREAVDTARVIRDARRAQSEFESLRRMHMPVMDRGSGPCDVTIGRFCYWADDGKEVARAPDPPRIIAGRDRLLRRLDSLQQLLPSDGWIAGQRVRYFLEAGRDTAAYDAAQSCAAERSWCLALAGYAFHTTGAFAAAEAAFDSALAAMPDDERCEWYDLEMVVADDVARRLDRGSCDEQVRLAERIWWLGTPLFLIGANDLRTEHFARLARARIEERASSPQATSWGKDLYELMLRYGWPTWYSKSRPSSAMMHAESSIMGHDPSPSFAFFPSRAAIDSAVVAPAGAWDLRARDARSRYAPTYMKHLRPLRHQLAVFRRGDSALVASAFDLSEDTSFAGASIRAGLFLSWDAHSLAGAGESTGTSGVLTSMAPWRPLLASVEAQAAERKSVARSRYGVRMPERAGRVGLSDILLFAPADSSPRELEQALPRALTSDRVEADRPLGVFWETYGIHPTGEVLGVSLTIEEISTSFLRRAARAVGLAEDGAPLRVRWQEVPDRGTRIASRAVTVNLSRLVPGRYRVRLTVTPNEEAPVVSTREIEIFRD